MNVVNFAPFYCTKATYAIPPYKANHGVPIARLCATSITMVESPLKSTNTYNAEASWGVDPTRSAFVLVTVCSFSATMPITKLDRT